MAEASGKKTVYAALAANAAIAVSKFVAAMFTGSSAMLAEGIHSVVDTGNEGLMLWGMRRSKRPPDEAHPFGYGQELYFWTLVVAIVIFAGGGGMSILEGVYHLLNPHPIENPLWSYGVLGTAMLFEGTSWAIALRGFWIAKGDDSFWHAVHVSKDPTLFIVLFEDSAALLGLVVAFVGVYLGVLLRNPYFDGGASIVIGLILAVVAFYLAYESKGLLIGEGARPEIQKDIHALALADPAVERAMRPLTMHFGPHEILLTMDVQFRDDLSAGEVTAAIDRLETRIREKHPDVKRILIEAEAIAQSAPNQSFGPQAAR